MGHIGRVQFSSFVVVVLAALDFPPPTWGNSLRGHFYGGDAMIAGSYQSRPDCDVHSYHRVNVQVWRLSPRLYFTGCSGSLTLTAPCLLFNAVLYLLQPL